MAGHNLEMLDTAVDCRRGDLGHGDARGRRLRWLNLSAGRLMGRAGFPGNSWGPGRSGRRTAELARVAFLIGL
jgi:hypothetical protein